MRTLSRSVVVLLSLLVLEAPALAWNDFGHMEVAAAAYKKLTRATKKRVAELLERNPSYGYWVVGARDADRDRVAFMRAATWADAIKRDSAYVDDKQDGPAAALNIGYKDKNRHKYWHYLDQPFSTDGTALIAPKKPNAATQIALFRTVLSGTSADDDVKSYDLVWLLHLVGDVHQPLHCASRFDKASPSGDQGGNKVKVRGNRLPPVCEETGCALGPPDELHAFYDTITGEGYGTRDIDAAVKKLPAADAAKAALLDEAVWFQEGLQLAQTAVYVAPIGPGTGPFDVDAAYQTKALALGNRRIALAGARLAAVLNAAFSAEAKAKRESPAVP